MKPAELALVLTLALACCRIERLGVGARELESAKTDHATEASSTYLDPPAVAVAAATAASNSSNAAANDVTNPSRPAGRGTVFGKYCPCKMYYHCIDSKGQKYRKPTSGYYSGKRFRLFLTGACPKCLSCNWNYPRSSCDRYCVNQ